MLFRSIAFYEARLPYYQKRRDISISCITNKLKDNNQKLRYVKAVYNNEIRLVKAEEDDIRKTLSKMGIDFSHYLETRGSAFTVQGMQKLEKENKELHEELQKLQSTSAGELWYNDLEELKIAYNKNYISEIGSRGTFNNPLSIPIAKKVLHMKFVE